jgi:hypothetical protein
MPNPYGFAGMRFLNSLTREREHEDHVVFPEVLIVSTLLVEAIKYPYSSTKPFWCNAEILLTISPALVNQSSAHVHGEAFQIAVGVGFNPNNLSAYSA